jgi:hypothetical protein
MPNFNATQKLLITHAKKLISKTRSLINKIVINIKLKAVMFRNVILLIARDNNVSKLYRYIIHVY